MNLKDGPRDLLPKVCGLKKVEVHKKGKRQAPELDLMHLRGPTRVSYAGPN